MKPDRTWILIADGARARVLSFTGAPRIVRPVAELDVRASHLPSHLLGDDRPGRVYESHGAARHAFDPRTDPHREAEARFARQLADMLEDCRAKAMFDRLAIIAPPIMLGDLRKALGAKTRRAVVAEIHKDLTKLPDKEILRHLEGELSLG